MTHRLAIFIGAGALVIAGAAAAAPGLQLDRHAIAAHQCQDPGTKQLVDVHYDLVNDYDSDFAGNAWANDTINRHLRIWQEADGTFCANVEDHGSFVTFAGASPSGLATVSAGIRGHMEGGYVTTLFGGTFAPSLPTHGELGTFDLGCTNAYTCAGSHPSYRSYFSSTSGDDLAGWGWIYHTARNGVWLNQFDVSAADGGDITG